MAVFIFTNLIAGVSGLDKSVINTANLLQNGGHDVTILNCVGKHGGFHSIETKWPLENDVNLLSLQAMAVDHGNLLHKKFNVALEVKQPLLKATFTEHDLLAIKALNNQLDETDFIIFTHPLQSLLYLNAINEDRRRVKTMLQIHGNYDLELHNKEILLESMDAIDRVQIVSSSMKKGIQKITRLDDDNIKYIPNVHFPRPGIKVVNEPKKNFVVSIIGSLQDRKNQIDAIKAIEKIEDQSIILDIWGKPVHNYGKFLEGYVRNTGLIDRINFRGIGTEEEIYRDTDLVLITSKHEGFGYTMIEAATQSVPTIAYNYDFGASEFIRHGENGFLLAMHDVDTLAKCIQQCATDPDLCSRLGTSALQTFEEHFSPEHILGLYNSVIPKGLKKSASVTNSFLRDGLTPIPRASISRATKYFLKRPVSEDVTFSTDGRVKFVKILQVFRDGSEKSVPFIVNGNEYIASIPLRDETKIKCIRQKYFLKGLTEDENSIYIINTNAKDVVEVISEYSREALNGDLVEEPLVNKNMFINRDGTNIKLHSYEALRSLTDENDQPIDFETKYVRNNGIWSQHVRYNGEFSKLKFKYNSGTNVISSAPELSYKGIITELLDIEKELDLSNYLQGEFYVWDLARATVIESLMMAFGLWDQHFKKSVSIAPAYYGSKKISEASKAEKLIFEFTRKGAQDNKTMMFQDGQNLVIEYPQSYGYTERSICDGPVYPIDEFTQASRRVSLATNQKYKPGLLEEAFKKRFGINFHFGALMDGRLLKFKKEHYFWSSVFQKLDIQEVIIPSAYWSAGIVHAAQQNGITVADLQYALITDLHPTMISAGKVNYSPNKLYCWSPYWARNSKKYNQKVVVERGLEKPESLDSEYDFCVMSQSRVKKRINQFVLELSKKRPDSKIALCLHPDDSYEDNAEFIKTHKLSNVELIQGKTWQIMNYSKICIGGYSTSLYEAAYIGKPTYVIPVPGFEVVESGIIGGIFRICNDVDELVSFEQPAISKTIF